MGTTLAIEVLIGFVMFLGGILVPRKPRRKFEVALQKLNGSYRDPALYEATWIPPGEKEDGPGVKRFKVRNINDIEEPYRTYIREGFRPKYEWMTRFFEGKDAEDT